MQKHSGGCLFFLFSTLSCTLNEAGVLQKKNNKTKKILIKIINFPMAWEQNKASEYLQATLIAASPNS